MNRGITNSAMNDACKIDNVLYDACKIANALLYCCMLEGQLFTALLECITHF